MAMAEAEIENDPGCSVSRLRTELMTGDVPNATHFQELALVISTFVDSTEIIQHAAQRVSTEEWKIETESDVIAAILMLKYTSPGTLFLNMEIHIFKSFALKELMEEIKTRFFGNLFLKFKFSYDSYTACDELIMLLSGARCSLGLFAGCLSTREALMVIPSIAYADAELWISVPDALQHQLGNMMVGEDFLIAYKVKYQSCTAAPRNRPLPFLINGLIVDCIPSSKVTDAAALILAIAPEDNKISFVRLRNCELSDADLYKLVYNLFAAGFRTSRRHGRPMGISSWTSPLCPFSNDLCRFEAEGCVDPDIPGKRCVYLYVNNRAPISPSLEF